MKLLCADTATRTESVALVDGDTILVERAVYRAKGHGRGLIDDIDSLLLDAGWTLALNVVQVLSSEWTTSTTGEFAGEPDPESPYRFSVAADTVALSEIPLRSNWHHAVTSCPILPVNAIRSGVGLRIPEP